MDWNSDSVEKLIHVALEEDKGAGDVMVAAIIPARAPGQAHILANQDLICAGLPLAEKIFQALDPEMKVDRRSADGHKVVSGQELLHLRGMAAAILTGERTALNLLGRLSGIATLTHQFVELIAGTQAKMCDTWKTAPGMRMLERYAFKIGGGANRPVDLFGGVLLKENHIAFAGGVKAALDQAHSYVSAQMKPLAMSAYEAVGPIPSEEEATSLPIEIEVRGESELREALSAGAEAVLLDHMSPDQARACVEIAGGITLENVRAYADTGADYLSSGALTQSAPNDVLSLLVDRLQ